MKTKIRICQEENCSKDISQRAPRAIFCVECSVKRSNKESRKKRSPEYIERKKIQQREYWNRPYVKERRRLKNKLNHKLKKEKKYGLITFTIWNEDLIYTDNYERTLSQDWIKLLVNRNLL